jgi:hypothetical protein
LDKRPPRLREADSHLATTIVALTGGRIAAPDPEIHS